MTENQLQVTGGLDRRSLLRGGMFTGLGVAALAIAAPATAMAAPRAATRSIKTAGRTSAATVNADAALVFQSDWWFCTSCTGLFWSSDHTDRGYCVVDPGYHIVGQTNYGVPHGNASATGLQVGWRYCTVCALLFWGPEVASSYCRGAFALGPHTPGDTVYDMMVTGYWPGSQQSNWRYCIQCQDLFWGGDESVSRCTNPVYYNHNVGSTNYSLFD